MPDEFCLKMLDFRDLRYGTDGVTSPPKGKRVEDFLALKNPTASVGFEPANLGTTGQDDTSRPPQPLFLEPYL